MSKTNFFENSVSQHPSVNELPCHHHEKLIEKYLTSVPTRLMPDTVRELRAAFDFFDLNANEKIGLDELRRIFQAVNMKKTNDECQEILNLYDLNNDGKIDFHEFIFALARLIKHDVFNLNDIHQRFSKFDESHNGKLRVSNLPNLIRKGFGIQVTDQEIFELLNKIDIVDETTQISFEKFIRMLQYAVRQSESAEGIDYMKKLNHRCGNAVKNVTSHDLKLLKKRTGGYVVRTMDESRPI